MKISRIVLYGALLFLLQTGLGALANVLWGPPMSANDFAIQYLLGFVVAVLVFALMSWTRPKKPYASAVLAGLLANSLGVLSVALILRTMSWWDPVTWVVDIAVFLVAVLLGVSLGLRYGRRPALVQTTVDGC
jgi:hypothetical protein